MTLEEFLQKLRNSPQDIDFNDTMSVIEQYYRYSPTAFHNGKQYNEAGENEGSCKILALGLLHRLTPEQTLHCFGKYYREDVLQHPDADSHQNIRQFTQTGWDGVRFSAQALTPGNNDPVELKRGKNTTGLKHSA